MSKMKQGFQDFIPGDDLTPAIVRLHQVPQAHAVYCNGRLVGLIRTTVQAGKVFLQRAGIVKMYEKKQAGNMITATKVCYYDPTKPDAQQPPEFRGHVGKVVNRDMFIDHRRKK